MTQEFKVGDVVGINPDAIPKIIERGITINCENCGEILGDFKSIEEVQRQVKLHAFRKHREILEGLID